MSKILTAQQTRQADQHTIAHEPIASIDLMERASMAFVDRLFTLVSYKASFAICCGTGNNGGDGLAIGRILHMMSVNVTLFVLGEPDHGSADFQTNLQRATVAGMPINFIESIDDLEQSGVQSVDVLIDAIFGSGLSRPIEAFLAETIRFLNATPAMKVSVDIASGLFADSHTPVDTAVFKPDVTIAFQLPKLTFFLPQYHGFVGELYVEDIGLDMTYIQSLPTPYTSYSEAEAAIALKQRPKFSHKGNFGHVLLMAGSEGKMGAAILAAKACLRAGAGLVTVYCPKEGLPIVQMAVPEAMAIADTSPRHLSNVPELDAYDAVAIGPGIGQHPDTVKLMGSILQKCNRPLVIDADALNIIALQNLTHAIPANSILTPHPKEFERLVGKTSDHFERLQAQRELSKKYNLNVLVKGAHSVVCGPDGNVSFNTTGNPGMATAGSGDVLTGMVAGLLAQGYLPNDALRLAVFLHGRSGDIAERISAQESVIASDLIDCLGRAFASLCSGKNNS